MVSLHEIHACLLSFFFIRVVQEDRQASVPRTRQCWKNNSPAHAQRRQTRTTRADVTSEYVQGHFVGSEISLYFSFFIT